MHSFALSCHVFYFGECTEMLPLQKIFHTQCRGRYPFGSKVQRSNIKSRQFLNLSLSTVQFEEPLSEKRAIQPQRLLLNPLQWIKKEPLRLKGASEVHHSRQNHPLKKVAPWVCTVGSRVPTLGCIELGGKIKKVHFTYWLTLFSLYFLILRTIYFLAFFD